MKIIPILFVSAILALFIAMVSLAIATMLKKLKDSENTDDYDKEM